MKTKTLNKKLVLGKNTIANLTNGTMKNVYGGGSEKTECRTICATDCGTLCLSCRDTLCDC